MIKYSRFIGLALLLYSTGMHAQEPLGKNRQKITGEYEQLKYEIIHIDTIVLHYTNGFYNSPGYRAWDSTKIWADIILNDFPKKVDSASLERKVKAIMKRHGIHKTSVFRDDYSSLLFRLNSAYAAKKLKERDGFLGWFDVYSFN